MEKTKVTKAQMVNQLMKIGHGDLKVYLPVCNQAIEFEPELFAHVIAWNHLNGKIRDSKVAFPVIALRGPKDDELYENAVAHLMLLDPRNLVRAIEFHKSLEPVKNGAGGMLKNSVKKYISVRENNRGWWNKTALQHRKSLKALYAYFHVKPKKFAQDILFNNKRPAGSVFEAAYQLPNMSPQEAAGTILNFKIPFQVAKSRIPGLEKKPDVIMALIEQMSGAELITNTNMLKRLGVFTSPVLKAAYEQAIEKTRDDTKISTLKASKAAEVVTDKKAKAALKTIQDNQLKKLGGIDGDWLVLGDKSQSMHHSIETARQVAALIAQQVKGKVHLVFFNDYPTHFDVTGKSYDEIKDITKRQRSSGMTSIGCGLQYIMEKGEIVNGIAVCTDGGDNSYPLFWQAYKKYEEKMAISPTVYIYKVRGDWADRMSRDCEREGIMFDMFDVDDIDYYALPAVVQTMRTSRYSLVDEIMETPLKKLVEVFNG